MSTATTHPRRDARRREQPAGHQCVDRGRPARRRRRPSSSLGLHVRREPAGSAAGPHRPARADGSTPQPGRHPSPSATGSPPGSPFDGPVVRPLVGRQTCRWWSDRWSESRQGPLRIPPGRPLTCSVGLTGSEPATPWSPDVGWVSWQFAEGRKRRSRRIRNGCGQPRTTADEVKWWSNDLRPDLHSSSARAVWDRVLGRSTLTVGTGGRPPPPPVSSCLSRRATRAAWSARRGRRHRRSSRPATASPGGPLRARGGRRRPR